MIAKKRETPQGIKPTRNRPPAQPRAARSSFGLSHVDCARDGARHDRQKRPHEQNLLARINSPRCSILGAWKGTAFLSQIARADNPKAFRNHNKQYYLLLPAIAPP